MHNEHRILLGISGGISAYKAPILVRLLRARGASVRVVMTESAKQFVAPLALQAVSNEPVLSDLWTADDPNGMDHIALSRWANQIVIAPATANCIARLASGMADDLLTTLCLASDAPLYLAPAMNKHMWAHVAVQDNVRTLENRGAQIIGPEAGEQACGDVGWGRMSEPEAIVDALLAASSELSFLSGKKILITAGPTRESIDPIRFLSNRSTGEMGYALAECAVAAGAEVTLVSGPTTLPSPRGVYLISVETAAQMHEAVLACAEKNDFFVSAAAVADYTVADPSDQKIKKTDSDLSLQLQRTHDILSDVMALKNKPFCIGFAAETENVLEQAEEKRQRKGLPVLIANEVGRDKGFGLGKASVTLLSDTVKIPLQAKSKKELAPKLWFSLANIMMGSAV